MDGVFAVGFAAFARSEGPVNALNEALASDGFWDRDDVRKAHVGAASGGWYMLSWQLPCVPSWQDVAVDQMETLARHPRDPTVVLRLRIGMNARPMGNEASFGGDLVSRLGAIGGCLNVDAYDADDADEVSADPPTAGATTHPTTWRCCGELVRQVADEASPIGYSPVFREWFYPHNKHSQQCLRHCPFCGARLPESLRGAYFDRLDELGYEAEAYWEDRVPEELKSDAWWRDDLTPRGDGPDDQR